MQPDKVSEVRPYGEIAYEAYGQNRGWQSWDGKPMPTWTDLRPDIQIAWQVAAEAAVLYYKHHYET